jgi:hypothetical protein
VENISTIAISICQEILNNFSPLKNKGLKQIIIYATKSPSNNFTPKNFIVAIDITCDLL